MWRSWSQGIESDDFKRQVARTGSVLAVLLGAQGSAPPGSSVWLVLHLHGVGGELPHHKCLSSTCCRPYEGSKGGSRKTPYVTRSIISLCDANFFLFQNY